MKASKSGGIGINNSPAIPPYTISHRVWEDENENENEEGEGKGLGLLAPNQTNKMSIK